MGDTSTLGLLFEIDADPSKANAAVEQFSSQSGANVEAFQAKLAEVSAASIAAAEESSTAIVAGSGLAAAATEEASARMISAHTEAREAVRGLGEEIGVTMPRFVSSYVTSLGPVQEVMAAAFAPIAILGVLELLERVPDAFDKMIAKAEDWDASAQRNYADLIKSNRSLLEEMDAIAEKQEEISLIGLTGVAKLGQEYDNAQADIKRTNDELTRQIRHQHDIQDQLDKLPDTLGYLAEDFKVTFGGPEQKVTVTNAKDLNAELERTGKTVDELKKKLLDLQQVKMPTIAAQTGPALDEDAKKKQKQARQLETETTKMEADELKQRGGNLMAWVKEKQTMLAEANRKQVEDDAASLRQQEKLARALQRIEQEGTRALQQELSKRGAYLLEYAARSRETWEREGRDADHAAMEIERAEERKVRAVEHYLEAITREGEALGRSVVEHGNAAKSIEIFSAQVLNTVLQSLAKKAEVKGAEQIAEALGSWPDGGAMAAHFAAAAAWEALAAATGFGGGALTAAANGGGSSSGLSKSQVQQGAMAGTSSPAMSAGRNAITQQQRNGGNLQVYVVGSSAEKARMFAQGVQAAHAAGHFMPSSNPSRPAPATRSG